MEIIAKRIARNTRIKLEVMYLIAISMWLLFYMGIIPSGGVSGAKALYLMQVVGVSLSLALVPVSLYRFKRAMTRMEGLESEERVPRYKRAVNQRLAALCLVMVYGLVHYGLTLDTMGIYLTGIAVVCSLFCFTTKAQVIYDLTV